MKPQVSSECEVELKFFCVLENLSQMGRLAFSFIDQGKDLEYTRERERGKEGRGKTEKKRALGHRRPSPQVGHTGPVDNNGSVRTS
jgi:hypothetical protein